MTRQQAAKLVLGIVGMYPQLRLTEEATAIWEAMLIDLDYGTASEALRRHVATSRWAPTVAELRDQCVAVELGEPRPALEAWGEVVRAAERIGSYRPAPRFDDPITAHCVDAMGWRYLCRSPNDMADRARFCELYEALRDAERRRAQLGVERHAPALRAPAPPPWLRVGGGDE